MSVKGIFFGGVVLSLLALGSASAQETRPNIFTVAADETVRIDKHGTCRRVINDGNTPLMIATNTAQEWSIGAGSFLVNVTNIPNVTVAACEMQEIFRQACQYIAPPGTTAAHPHYCHFNTSGRFSGSLQNTITALQSQGHIVRGGNSCAGQSEPMFLWGVGGNQQAFGAGHIIECG